MIQVTATIEGLGKRILLFSDTEETARTIARDRLGVHLDEGGLITQPAFNGRIQLGQWQAEPAPTTPGLLATWVGPRSDGSAAIEEDQFPAWLAQRLAPLLDTTDPDVWRSAGQIGDWLPSGLGWADQTVKDAIAFTAAQSLAPVLLQGNQVSIGQHLLSATRVEPEAEEPVLDDTGDDETTESVPDELDETD